MDRRSWLRRGTVLLTGFVGGCLSRGEQAGSVYPSNGTPKGPLRGKHDVNIEVSKTEESIDVEYLESEDAVKFVSRWELQTDSTTGTPQKNPVYDTEPFEDFAKRRTAEIGASRAAQYVSTNLSGIEMFNNASNINGEKDMVGMLVISSHRDDGTEGKGEDVEFESIVNKTPATISSAYILDGQEYENDVPIYVREGETGWRPG